MKKRIGSIKKELSCKAREAMLSAVQIYNNPNILFKAETFTILSIIAWTYLMHAYYKEKKIDYCYYKLSLKGRKKYDKTKYGAKKHWELERCLNDGKCPLDSPVKENIRFLIGLRHEIEHQMTTRIDNTLSAKFQACCLNFNASITELLGVQYNISDYLSFSLQFSSISEPQIEQLSEIKDLPPNISSYMLAFEDRLEEQIYNDPKFSYRVLFVPKTANRKGQADKVIEFVKPDSPEAEGLNVQYALIKESEKKKYLPSAIVSLLKAQGYNNFNMYQFTKCWKEKNAKNDNSYGCQVGNDKWYWYENFISIARQYCIDNNLK